MSLVILCYYGQFSRLTSTPVRVRLFLERSGPLSHLIRVRRDSLSRVITGTHEGGPQIVMDRVSSSVFYRGLVRYLQNLYFCLHKFSTVSSLREKAPSQLILRKDFVHCRLDPRLLTYFQISTVSSPFPKDPHFCRTLLRHSTQSS